VSELFRRRASLRVGESVWDGLRLTFVVRRTLRKRPNLAQGIRVYGLDWRTVGSIMTPGAAVQLSAGYETTAEVVFSGQITRAQQRREGADQVTEITAEDGSDAWGSVTSRVLGGSVALRSLVETLAQDMGLTLTAESAAVLTGVARKSTVLRGYARDQLDVILRSAGYTWSIQDGALQVLREGAALATQAVVLGPQTGLVGDPKPLEKGRGWLVESLMQPKIKPGRTVLLKSERAEGAYRATIVEHHGDTHSQQPWTTRVELRP